MFFAVKCLLLTASLCCCATLGAQKIDIDKKAVTTQLLILPSKDVDTSFRTFSYKFNNSYHLTTWGMDLENAQNSYFKLGGYQTLPANGDLQLEATLQAVRFLETNIESRVEKSKDKAGRETSKTYYKYTVSYDGGFSWKMLDKTGKEYTSRTNTALTSTVRKHTGSEYGTYKEASDAYYNNRQQINRDLAAKLIQEHLSSMYLNMNSQFGYRPDAEKFNLWVLDTKNHAEYEPMQKHYEAVKAAFANMSPAGLTPADTEALQASMDYYRSLPEKYKADEKADTKLRYAAYFNLCNIYLFIDQPDQAVTYANLLIQNDYDKGDGKDFIKDAERLRELFQKKQVNARRLPRT